MNIKIKEVRSIHFFMLILCLAIEPLCSGCREPVLANVVAGLQDGLVTTSTGLINTFFDQQFSVDTSTQAQGSGDDLFVRM